MKVLFINGSPHKSGNTAKALSVVKTALEKEGIETETVTVGDKVIAGCIGCGQCKKTGKCFRNDIANVVQEKIVSADGLIIGTPVYFASPNGSLISLLDRVFCGRELFIGKPACAVAVARRAGTTATIDVLNKYFAISGMPIISSQYWNMVFGEGDEEGYQTMKILGEQMAYAVKCFDIAKKNGINPPKLERHIYTNFIR